MAQTLTSKDSLSVGQAHTEVTQLICPLDFSRNMAEITSNTEIKCDVSNTSIWNDHTYTSTQKLQIYERPSSATVDNSNIIMQEDLNGASITETSPIPLKLMKLDSIPSTEVQDTNISKSDAAEHCETLTDTREDDMMIACSVVVPTPSTTNESEFEVEYFNELPFITSEEKIDFTNEINEENVKKQLNRRERRKLKKRNKMNTSLLSEEIINLDDTSWAELPFAAEAQVPGENEIRPSKIKIKKRKKKTKSISEEATDKIKRPNYFVAIHIDNSEIIQNVKHVQNQILEKNKAFKKALISLATLHITLAVMHLDIPDLKGAFEAMTTCNDKLSKEFNDQPLNLPFQGVAHFPSGVLFAKIKGTELNRLAVIANVIQEAFTANGIPVSEKDFQAHLTILKLSKLPYKTKKVIKRIYSEHYEEYKDMAFGNQTVSSLQLLSMTDPKDDKGYYHCLKEITFIMNK